MVESDPALSRVLVRVLEHDRYLVATAADLASARAAATSGGFEIVVFGETPDRAAVIKELHTMLPAATILMLGSATSSTTADLVDVGVDDVLAKPFSIDEFRNALVRMEARLAGLALVTPSVEASAHNASPRVTLYLGIVATTLVGVALALTVLILNL